MMRMTSIMTRVIGALFLTVSMAGAEQADARRCAEADAAAPIIQRREAFNVAIRDGALDAVADVLAEDVVLVAGSHSDLFLGREAQLAIWRSEFGEGDNRMIYVRTPECVQRSAVAPIALEDGHWLGQGQGETFAAGRYSAKWRRIEGEWRLEGELFMTDRCSGEACPD